MQRNSLIKRIKEYWRLNDVQIVVFSITIIISSFIVFFGCKFIPINNKKPKEKPYAVVKDTIYIRSSKTDSLLEDISMQVHEINNKLKKPQSIRYKKRVKAKDDTIRIDASVRVSNNSSK